MGEKIGSFKDLRVWQRGIELVKRIYQLTASFPKEEQYGLTSQMRRASVSIPSNIAEGFRRRFSKEQKQFLNIAIGSCAELQTQLIISKELGFISDEVMTGMCSDIDNICGMAVNLCKKL